MISPELRKIIIEEIGPNYGNKLLKLAKKRNFKKERGGGYYQDPQLFYQSLKGKYENKRIEAFILKAYKYFKKKNAQQEKELQAIITQTSKK